MVVLCYKFGVEVFDFVVDLCYFGCLSRWVFVCCRCCLACVLLLFVLDICCLGDCDFVTLAICMALQRCFGFCGFSGCLLAVFDLSCGFCLLSSCFVVCWFCGVCWVLLAFWYLVIFRFSGFRGWRSVLGVCGMYVL